MKIRVDVNSCSGQARCEAIAPEVFVLNDVGYNATDEKEVGEALLAAACRGALACPEGAITIVDDQGHEMDDSELRKSARLKP
jgi:ferredoxin